MFNVGPEKLMVVLLVALIVLGPDKLPNAARQIGRYLNEFRRISQGFQQELRSAIDMAADPVSTITQPTPDDPTTPASAAPAPDVGPGGPASEAATVEAPSDDAATDAATLPAPTAPTVPDAPVPVTRPMPAPVREPIAETAAEPVPEPNHTASA